jgi:lipocalin
VERIARLYPTGPTVFATAQTGLVSWDRASGRFRSESGPEAPGADATAVATAGDGRVYVGLPSGLAWREALGAWQRTSQGPLAGGVTALAPRSGGGVWVGMAGGLGWFDAGTLHVVNERHRVRQLATAPNGDVWAGTDGFGVVRLGPRLQEFTAGEGLCGNRVRSVFAGPGGRVGVTCLEARGHERFSLFDGTQFRTYALADVPGTALRLEPLAEVIVLRTDAGDWALDPAPGGVAPVGRPRALPTADPGIAPPPMPDPPSATPAALAPPSAPTTAAPSGPGGNLTGELGLAQANASGPIVRPGVPLPAQVPMPMPIASPSAPAQTDAPLPVERGPAPTTGGAPFVLRSYPAGVPQDAPVTATATSPDGTTWYALEHRGVVAVKGADRQRYVSSTLSTLAGQGNLHIDRTGRVLAMAGRNRLYRWQDNSWNLWVVDPDPAVRVLAVTVDNLDQVWILADSPAEAKLRVYKSMDGRAFFELGRVDAPKFEGALSIGDLVIDASGRLVCSLFWTDARGQRRGGGLGVVSLTLDRMDRWVADTGLEGPPPAGEVRLPDAFVNRVARLGKTGALLVGTNSGLARIDGTSIRTWGENVDLPSEVVLDAVADPSGRIYVGTSEGFGYLEQDVWHRVRNANLRGRIDAVAVDASGRVWIGGEHGLFVGDGVTFQSAASGPSGFDFGPVRRIVPDAQGAVWVLTSRGIVRGADHSLAR